MGYIFFAMAVGMAVGTKFYIFGAFLTFMIAGIMFAMAKWNIGAKPFAEVSLNVVVGKNTDYQKDFHNIFYRSLESQALL